MVGTKDTYKFKSTDVAKYIIAYANENHVSINVTKIQKLLYISYGIYLAVKKSRLTDEHPQAWPYGPVFPTTRNKILKMHDGIYSIKMNDHELEQIQNDNEMLSLMRIVFNSFGNWTAGQLTAWSHSEGSPWEMATCLDGFKWGMAIPDSYIYNYFRKLIKEDEQ